jgi:hypothetical protein
MCKSHNGTQIGTLDAYVHKHQLQIAAVAIEDAGWRLLDEPNTEISRGDRVDKE